MLTAQHTQACIARPVWAEITQDIATNFMGGSGQLLIRVVRRVWTKIHRPVLCFLSGIVEYNLSAPDGSRCSVFVKSWLPFDKDRLALLASDGWTSLLYRDSLIQDF